MDILGAVWCPDDLPAVFSETKDFEKGIQVLKGLVDQISYLLDTVEGTVHAEHPLTYSLWAMSPVHKQTQQVNASLPIDEPSYILAVTVAEDMT